MSGELEAPSAEKTYLVIEEDFDTRIRESYGVGGDVGEYETFREARDAAVEYLESHIELCETALAGIRHADTYDQYVRN